MDLTNQDVWTQISQIPDTELWRTHERRRERLIAFARNRNSQKRPRSTEKSRTQQNTDDQARVPTTTILNSAALTIGFARRFAHL